MKQVLAALVMLGVSSAVLADKEAPASPEAEIRKIFSPEDMRFFMNEARRALNAAAKGESYVPAPETATRARLIGERMREKGFGLMELMLDQIEQELSRLYPPEPGVESPPVSEPSDRTRT